MVGSGLTQDDVAARLVVRPGNIPDLNQRENLRLILQGKLDSEEPSTSVQQPTERLKSGSPDTLELILLSKPNRVAKIVTLSGELVGMY